VRTTTPAAPTVSPTNGAAVKADITVTSGGATCKWGASSTSVTNASNTTRTTTAGTNTL
jgi:hypothetical protein